MPLRYSDIVDAAFVLMHQRPPTMRRAIALAYAKAHVELTMDVLVGNTHADIALRLKQYLRTVL